MSALLGAGLVGVMAAGLVAVPAQADPPPQRLARQTEKVDKDGTAVRVKAWPYQPQRPVSAPAPAPVWPRPGRATVTLPTGDQALRAAGLPVTVARAGGPAGRRTSSVSVELLDRSTAPKGWRDGLLMRVTGPRGAVAEGAAELTVDYRDFRHAHGADWASRLRLWRLPQCAVTTPGAPGCAATPLDSANDVKAGLVSATVPVAAASDDVTAARTATEAATMVALAAGPSGPSGDFTATSLAPSATWTSGGSAGDFSWSYPMQTPPSIAGAAPTLSVSYSSSSVDGRSGVTNNQPSWLGEGFDFAPGYIERTYVNCVDDMANSPNNTTKTGDLCWRSDNATLSLNGTGSELVHETGKGWHARDEDASRIEKLTGATHGGNDGEYWKVTGGDGTQYFFGRHSLPGQTSTTDSAWTVPVAGNHVGEPCRQTEFKSSFCNQVWRWNLDYVVDTHGNTISYWYAKETNKYARNITDTDVPSYVRGGHLTRIDYGTWDRGATDRSVKAVAQVVFAPGDRCVTSSCATHNATNWPDTPWDQECTGSTCAGKYSPTFWSTKRLAKATTRVWDTTKATPAWQDIDSWTFTHSFPSAGDGSDHAGMWLQSIVRAGLHGTPVTLPPVTFTPISLPNRVLTQNNTSNNWQRIDQIITEAGAKIDIEWELPDCSATSLPSAAHTNTRLCYPVLVPDPNDPTGKALVTEWWHKHRVKSISESDLPTWSAGHQAPPHFTYYEYEGAPAWHYADDDGLVKTNRKTWNQFRGYATVKTRTGDVAGAQTLVETRYLRGMHGDRLAPSGGTREVTVGASLGSETVYDEDQFAGMIREQILYNGADTKPVSKTVNVPWRSPAMASRTINGDTVTARFTGVKATYSAEALGVDGARGWRTTRTQSWFSDTYGTAERTQDDGDLSRSGDETCVVNTYNRSTGANLVKTLKQVTTTSLPCGTAPTSTDHVSGDVRYYYDGATSVDTAPTRGLVTRTESLKDWTTAGGTVWQTTKQNTFDVFGRPLTATDLKGNVTQTAYTPASGGPVTLETTTIPTPFSWVSTKEKDLRGQTTRTTDPNNRITDVAYDGLGRTWRVWNAGWSRTGNESSPSVEYTYWFAPNRDAYPYTRTRTLHAGGGYRDSYQILDSLLRERQTQTAGIGGGAVVADTIYDRVGRASTSYRPHLEPGSPSGTLWWEPEWSVPAVTKTVFDNAGRPVAQIFLGQEGTDNLVEKWRTTTSHEGDLTKVTPPLGGTPTTTVTDIEGRTVELRQHTSGTGVAGPYQSTHYSYNAKGKLVRVTDHLGDKWTYAFDMKGRVTHITDPDKGSSVSQYNDYNELEKTTDARGESIWYVYDALGRKSELRDDSATGSLRVKWKYDRLYTGSTVGAKGQLTEAYRYEYVPGGTTSIYKWQVGGFNGRGQPTNVNHVVPAVEGSGLAATWTIGYGYSPYDGSPTSVSYPAAGALPDETVTTVYDGTTGLPTGLTSTATGVGSYVTNQAYTAYGEPTVTTRKTAGGVYVEDALYYDEVTRRVSHSSVKPETATGTVSDRHYSYDHTGNVTSIADLPQVGSADTQCFLYDALRRLTTAWTPKSGVTCGTDPAVANLGGPAPYWLHWTMDEIGNRKEEVNRAAAGETKRTYATPTPGADVARPHSVDAMTTTLPGQSPVTTAYRYDNSGNTVCRPSGTAANDCGTGAGSQVLAWDAEGRLTSVTAGGATVEGNVYDAEGTRLIRRDATGTTLYLPGQDVRRNTASVISGTRYYAFGGRVVASRVASGLTWVFSDHQGTQHTSVNAASQAVSLRRQLPYGGSRGSVPAWPNSKGFVGGEKDPTGLTHLGARKYDPVLGRFISVDPVQDLSDPQQWNSYAYSNNNPVTFSDPSGQKFEEESWADYNRRLIEHDRKQREKAKPPKVKNTVLKGHLNAIYNREVSSSWKGDGKLGTAVRLEIRTSQKVNANKDWHYKKGAEVFLGLSKLLEADRKARSAGKPPVLSDRERQIALDESRELWSSLNTDDPNNRFVATVASTAQGREHLDEAKRLMGTATSEKWGYSTKEFTGSGFKEEKRGTKVTGLTRTVAPRLGGVANTLSVVGDLLLIYEVGKAAFSDNPEGALREILCGMGSPACAGPIGNDGLNSYWGTPSGEIIAVPNA
ncbi:RHS repeat-associated core domain-containing protein [Micromonospora purpureochromogenes]|uniref:RHS repeat-associated protein n=1 Tax=Micromonospora purpureochromogenes TaxID=47872 RepID=A0ABX2RNV4_9ACTN|nr:RHS repeat-associated core domain-containing protein [Micromonospora purpureochromogenes]NYF56969.1 RHS repeat-associated protein [Micromonospora purpureochromogenes]